MSTTDLYLIAHVCRGEPTFDVAERQPCFKCQEAGEYFERPDCSECDGEGHWWILSTPGYRAYPWWSEPLSQCVRDFVDISQLKPVGNSADVFACNDRPSTTIAPTGAKALLARLGLTRTVAPIKRRL